MSDKIIIHCDKCDSTEVLHEQIFYPQPDQHLTMTQMAEVSKMGHVSHSVYIHTNYRMVCKSCGHIVKYSV